MKKLSIFLASMAAVIGFTACEDPKEPVLQTPTTFEMNVPAMQDQYLDLSVNGGTFELVAAAQPNYGYSAITTYSALVSLTPDFANTVEIKSNGKATQSRMQFNNADLALSICQLKGIENEDQYVDEPAIPVYFKGVAELAGVEGTRIVSSNYVVLNKVKYYFAVPTPGYIWVIGSASAFGGWTEPKADNKAALENSRLFEAPDAIGSQIYKGSFEIPAGKLDFRFYVELNGWGDASVSRGPDESLSEDSYEDSGAWNVPFDWTGNGIFQKPLSVTKNNFEFANWAGGTLNISVNLKENIVTLTAGDTEYVEPEYIYMIGNNSGWATPDAAAQELYDNWRLADTDGSGIYVGTFDMTEDNVDGNSGNCFCRFIKALNGWVPAEWSADADGGNVDVTLGSPMPTFVGEGCFVIPSPAGKKLTVKLDTNANNVTFTLE